MCDITPHTLCASHVAQQFKSVIMLDCGLSVCVCVCVWRLLHTKECLDVSPATEQKNKNK